MPAVLFVLMLSPIQCLVQERDRLLLLLLLLLLPQNVPPSGD